MNQDKDQVVAQPVSDEATANVETPEQEETLETTEAPGSEDDEAEDDDA